MAEKTIHLKRTSLYASGASPVNMIQAIFYNEDMLIYDLEDSVPAVEKDAARFLVYNMVKNHRPKDKYVCIRVNGIYSEYLETYRRQSEPTRIASVFRRWSTRERYRISQEESQPSRRRSVLKSERSS